MSQCHRRWEVPKSRLGWGVGFVSLVIVQSVGLADSPPEVPEVLATLAREADPAENPFLNAQRAAVLRQQIERADDPRVVLRLRWELAGELLLAGESQAALDELDRLEAALRQPGSIADPALFEQIDDRRVVAWMRLGEQQNCLAHHTGAACILPLGEAARHREPEGSRRAIEILDRLFGTARPSGERVWLRNLAAMTLGEYPEGVPERFLIDPSFFASDTEDFPRFENRAIEAGVAVEGLSGGVVLEDLDGDVDLDLVVSSWGLEDPLRVFRNRGNGTFEERTKEAGVEGQLGGLHLVHADIDNDGDADVLVLRGGWLGSAGHHPNSLLLNDGTGRFRDATGDAGLYAEVPSQTAAFADFDGDGDLDLFVGTESTPGDINPCLLHRNRGDGTFDEVAAAFGVDVVGYVKGVAWGDVEGDGDLDLFLSRFEGTNILLRNDGPVLAEDGRETGWRFTDVTGSAGVADPMQSFPTWFWDWDQDGDEDLFVAPFPGLFANNIGFYIAEYLQLASPTEMPRLYVNRGDGTFEDHAREAGLHTTLLTMGSGWGDLDQDGDPDAYLGTGEPNLSTLVPNRMFLNVAPSGETGRRFLDVTSVGGFGHLQKGHGVAFGDVDLDGDVDVHAVLGGAYSGDVAVNALFVNPGFGRPWVTLILEGARANRSALGARVRIVTRTPDGDERVVHRTVGPRGSFSGGPLRIETGLGDAETIDRVEVRWPAPGRNEVFRGVAPGSIWRLREGEAPQKLKVAPRER